MEQLEKWISKLNKQQKLIIGIAIPLFFLFLTLKIADVVTYGSRYYIRKTWWVWLLYIVIVCLIEIKIFEHNNQQKLIIGITVPLFFLFLTLKIADVVTYGGWYGHSNPFRFRETWWVWLLYIVIVGLIEIKLFEHKNNKLLDEEIKEKREKPKKDLQRWLEKYKKIVDRLQNNQDSNAELTEFDKFQLEMNQSMTSTTQQRRAIHMLANKLGFNSKKYEDAYRQLMIIVSEKTTTLTMSIYEAKKAIEMLKHFVDIENGNVEKTNSEDSTNPANRKINTEEAYQEMINNGNPTHNKMRDYGKKSNRFDEELDEIYEKKNLKYSKIKSGKISESKIYKNTQTNYYLTIFDFLHDYDEDRKKKIVRDTYKRLNQYYFPNNSMPVSENIILIKERDKGKIDMHIENELMLNNEKTAVVEFDCVKIEYFIIPVIFNEIKKYLVNKYSQYEIDYLKGY